MGDVPGVSRAYSFFRSGTHPIKKANRDRSETMLHQDVHFGLGRERRVQMRREVEHNRMKARLAAVRLGKDAGPEEAGSRRSLAARSATVIISLFR